MIQFICMIGFDLIWSFIYITIEIAIYKYECVCIPFWCSLNISSVSKNASSLYFSSAWIWTHPLPTEFSIFLNLYSMALHSLEESSISLWMIKPEEKKYPMLRCQCTFVSLHPLFHLSFYKLKSCRNSNWH